MPTRATIKAGTTTHEAYDLIAEGFGPGANGPILVVADTSQPGAAPSAAAAFVDALRATPGVASVTDAQPNQAGTAALATLFPTTGPQSEATERLVHHLRDDVVPQATDGTGLVVNLGGQTASSIDFSDVIGDRLPIFIGAVLVLSFLLLMLVFRSVLVPLKAVLMNLLSIGAAYGVIVAAFQWGWGGDLLGVSAGPDRAVGADDAVRDRVRPLDGLRGVPDERDPRALRPHAATTVSAVADGLESTARVITAAALIMVFVFGSFVVSDVRALKLIGLGLAVAVAIDATIVRIVLVPATMELLGNANWWLPRWLQRVVPTLAHRADAGRTRGGVRTGGGAGRRRPLALGAGIPTGESRREPAESAPIARRTFDDGFAPGRDRELRLTNTCRRGERSV